MGTHSSELCAGFDPVGGLCKPFTLASNTQFRAGPPPALTSAQYTADFNEVKMVGGKTTSTAQQIATARFWADPTKARQLPNGLQQLPPASEELLIQ